MGTNVVRAVDALAALTMRALEAMRQWPCLLAGDWSRLLFGHRHELTVLVFVPVALLPSV